MDEVASGPPGAALRLGGDASPAPEGTVPAGALPPLLLSAVPAHPSNVVDVPYRIDGGLLRVAHAVPASGGGASPGAQPFVAHLPSLRPGQRLEYRAELHRAGRLLGTAPADGSWMSVTAGPAAAAGNGSSQPDPRSPFPPYCTSGAPRFQHSLEFLGALTVKLRAEVLGETPEGYRINFFVEHGEAHGPRLHGRVRPEGGDWMCIRPDGVGEVDIKITYETPDGALILEQSGGVFDIGPKGYADVRRGIYRGAPPFFATPTYVTSHPAWKWINFIQCFGFGRVVMHELRVECDIYAPHVTGGPPVA